MPPYNAYVRTYSTVLRGNWGNEINSDRVAFPHSPGLEKGAFGRKKVLCSARARQPEHIVLYVVLGVHSGIKSGNHGYCMCVSHCIQER